jgi:hypothetical protein
MYLNDIQKVGTSMSVVNKAVVRRLSEEAFGQGKPEVIDEVLNPDIVCYDPTPKAERLGYCRRTSKMPSPRTSSGA